MVYIERVLFPEEVVILPRGKIITTLFFVASVEKGSDTSLTNDSTRNSTNYQLLVPSVLGDFSEKCLGDIS